MKPVCLVRCLAIPVTVEAESGTGLPHSRTLRESWWLARSRQRPGVRQSCSAFAVAAWHSRPYLVWPERLLRIAGALGLTATLLAAAWGQDTRQIDLLLAQGHFQQASHFIARELGKPGLAAAVREQLRFELDRVERIRKDYPLTAQDLYAALRKSVKDVNWDEFQLWIREGRFDSRPIDGTTRFMVTSVSNLFFRHPELNERRVPQRNSAAYDRAIAATCEGIQAAARTEGKPYVLPKRFQATMTVSVKPGVVPAHQPVRAWLPVPREYPFQNGFELLSSSSAVRHLAPANSPIRSVLLEQPAARNKRTEFKVQYAYTTYGVWFELDPVRVRACDPTDSLLAPYLGEAPHVQFTPGMRALAHEIAGQQTNCLLRAKAYYHWIAENIKYSFALEYSTIRDLGEYCRTNRYGDCGQEALLFITLCRLSGIPARWQSGWSTFPGAKTIHDWAEVYLAPYGWVPVDPYMGIYAMRYANTLSPEKRTALRDFYFGGLDQYRMIANSDHCQGLVPPKRALRSDTVDFQRGELEAADDNIYFDQYSYDLAIKEVKLPRNENIQ